jgi:enhancing lycopene biosynthesis protein 2
MLAIRQQGGTYQCFAPNIDQHHVINHITGEEMNETRNVLIESARISRGDVKDLSEFTPADFDALLIPGGFGVAKNLCNFAFKGSDCEVIPPVAKAIKATHKTQKPIGALCISPVLLAGVLGDVDLTIGQDDATIQNLEKMGTTHIKSTHGEVIIDKKNNVFSTPCYMLDATIEQIYEGASNIVKSILDSLK